MNYKIIDFKNKRFIVVPKLQELGLKHCFTSSDMNLRYGCDNKENGKVEDFNIISDFLGLLPKRIFFSKQEHTNNFTIIDRINLDDLGQDFTLGRIIADNDGFISNLKDICFVSRHADCTPIILFDPVNKVHGNLHSGWKGSLQEISKLAIEAMIENYNSDPKDILAVLGPSISFEDFEVEKDVVDLFLNTFSDIDTYIYQKNDVKYHIDLNAINIKILLESGLEASNILNIDLTTMSDPLFHSYRRDGDKFKLMGLITAL